MTDIPFKAGDVVKVKSGGPDMTVTQTGERAMTGEPTVWCVWFDGKKKMDDTFEPEALEKVVERPLQTSTRIRPTSF